MMLIKGKKEVQLQCGQCKNSFKVSKNDFFKLTRKHMIETEAEELFSFRRDAEFRVPELFAIQTKNHRMLQALTLSLNELEEKAIEAGDEIMQKAINTPYEALKAEAVDYETKKILKIHQCILCNIWNNGRMKSYCTCPNCGGKVYTAKKF